MTKIIEKFDQVNENDTVIGVTDKKTAHASRHIHRIVAVLAFDNANKLIVQIHKSSGGLFDNSVGGHVKKGETYDEAVRRECQEELNIQEMPLHLDTYLADEGDFLHMTALYVCKVHPDWIFEPNDEVEEVLHLTIEEIDKKIRLDPTQFTGGFLWSMKKLKTFSHKIVFIN